MNGNLINRKENIILVAIDLLDEKGIQGMTTKEIANRQGISEAAIYKQFLNKKEIILEILQRFSDFDENLNNTIKEQHMGCIEGIKYFIDTYGNYYQNYPQIATILLSYDMYHYDTETNDKMNKIIKKKEEMFEALFRYGQENKEINADIDYKDLAEAAVSLIFSTIHRWKMNNCSYSVRDKLNRVFDLLLLSYN